MENLLNLIPDDTDRTDGILKVTGGATYSAEYKIEGLTYGVLVQSTIAKGKITVLETKKAEGAPGVIKVLSHLNLNNSVPRYAKDDNVTIDRNIQKVFYNDQVYFAGQPIALVIADTYERAVYAASLIKANYQEEKHHTYLEKNLENSISPEGKDYLRNEKDAYKNSEVYLEAEYHQLNNIHNPMELGSITANWESDEKLTVYDKTQGVFGSQKHYAGLYGMDSKNVRVIAPFVGGAFGMALHTWPYQDAAVIGAKITKLPLKLMLTRMQMFTMVGYRPETKQFIGIGASKDGVLNGITHNAWGVTSTYDNFTEGTVGGTQFMYKCPNVNTQYKLVKLDVSNPIWMRGPGEATGMFALECAMDELAFKLNMDPIAFRLKNYATVHPVNNLPWSSKFLDECYELGAKKIGWYNRNPKPKSMTEDGMLVGYGMASGVFNAGRGAATARVILDENGKLTIQSAITDIGPGTGVMMKSVAMDSFKMDAIQIIVELGDTNLPPAPTQGGSNTTSSVGSAVYDACTALKEKMVEVYNQSFGEQKVYDDFKFNKEGFNIKGKSFSYVDLLKKAGLKELEVTRESRSGTERQKYVFNSFSVHFTKVHVHPLTGMVKVKEVVCALDAGKIISEKQARSQMIGGVVGGIGMALTEEGVYDHRYGVYTNNNFADYHVPVHADIPPIDVLFVNKPDPYINPIGAKGLGEVSIIGLAPSIANAIFHATGKRVRDLPITLDKIAIWRD
ncbi:aldehyde oxidase [Pedobacter psychrophilus]|uniref:Aldehyde oxidase n=1 Tax=Pedobacter psychrophilus TaxID=1826909 RepID=A0A179DBM0_9SPHI|nr:xanthine dehydrogenase family protein molybdopterin-binding subunit [Pedobacter psychrophilus]OAQ38314.1 aldehyde oxidase [Pedobacter psychrophilus]